jgi:hypothetical protein
VNAHLTAAEAGYILFNSNARAIVGSAQQAATLSAHGTHLRAGLPGLRVVADSDLDGWRRYPECVSHQPSHRSPTKPKAIYSQYSSGTTGQPKESGVSAPASRRPKRPTRSAALRGDGHGIGSGLCEPCAARPHRTCDVVVVCRLAASPRSCWRSSNPKGAWTRSPAIG